ncbi:MAG: DUF1588 domain-containing protein [Myxococcales bacterium]|nr:DUF1588 domain-containing protein [Myxococcales bacterium]
MIRWLMCLPLVVGCTGEVVGGAPGDLAGLPGGASAEHADEPLKPVVCEPVAPPLASRIVRIDASSYARTVEALYNYRGQYQAGRVKPPLPFTRRNLSEPFTTYASASIDEFDLDDLLLAARTVGEVYPAYAISRSSREVQAAPASEASQRVFINSFFTTLFNRPATAPEMAERLDDFRSAIAAGVPHIEAYDLMMRAMLMSPALIFREELGGPAGLLPYERAKLLSYGLQGLPPDPDLWRLSGDGGISQDEVFRTQFKRLTMAPEKLHSLRRFLREYYGWDGAMTVTKNDASFHNPTRLISNSEDLVAKLVAEKAHGGLLRGLLTSPVASTDSQTSQSWFGRNVDPATVPPRAGVMTHPAWLVAFSEMDHNNLVRRGRFLRERVLCTPVPQLPAGVVPELSKEAGKTYRRRLEEQTADPSCAGCHSLMNSLGGAFEGYDHLGRPQTVDNGAPVDTSGVLHGLASGPVTFQGPTELMAALGDAPEVHACFLRNLFTYYVGRQPTREDECELRKLEEVYRASGEDTLAVLEELFVWQASFPRVPSE